MTTRKLQRALVLILLTTGTLLFCVDLFSGGTNRPQADRSQTMKRHTLIRAVQPLPRGTVIQPHHLAVVQSEQPPPAGVLSRLQEVSGRVATRDIAADEALSNANTARSQGLGGLASLVPAGMRAVAIRVTDELAVANLIQPGDRVDLLVISNSVRAARGDKEPFPEAEVRTILQNALVLAVGEAIIGSAAGGKDYRNVSLAVTPREAGLIALARTVGTHYLALRAANDASSSRDAWALTTQDLHYLDLPAESGRLARGEKPTRTVEIISGSKRQMAVVPQAEVR